MLIASLPHGDWGKGGGKQRQQQQRRPLREDASSLIPLHFFFSFLWVSLPYSMSTIAKDDGSPSSSATRVTSDASSLPTFSFPFFLPMLSHSLTLSHTLSHTHIHTRLCMCVVAHEEREKERGSERTPYISCSSFCVGSRLTYLLLPPSIFTQTHLPVTR